MKNQTKLKIIRDTTKSPECNRYKTDDDYAKAVEDFIQDKKNVK